jgi:hypothetical protein
MAPPRLDGIDTSHWQTLTGAPLPNLVFAMHKASEGRSYHDPTMPKFTAYYRASASVKHVGFYHFLRSDSSAAEQAKNFIDAVQGVGGLKPGEFWVCDWERDNLGGFASVATVVEFCRLVSAVFGKTKGAVYSAPWVTGFKEWRFNNPHTALFLANYRTSPLLPNNGWAVSAQTGAVAWQYTGKGKTPGIAGNCDQNMVMQPAWFAALTPAPTFAPEVGIYGDWPTKKVKRYLRKGMDGDDVRYVQGVLKNEFDYPIHVTGKYDDYTADCVRWLQGSNGLTISGWVNKDTWPIIDKAAAK